MSAQIIRALSVRADQLDREADQLDDKAPPPPPSSGIRPTTSESILKRWLAAEFRSLADKAEETG